MIIEEEVYLEHYGKKGMKWGQRRANKKKTAAANKANRKRFKANYKENRTPQQKRAERIGNALTIGSFVAAGAMFVAAAAGGSGGGSRSASSARRMATPVSRIPTSTVSQGASFARSIPAIPMGPIGSTAREVSRVRGAIPLP